MQKEFVTVTPDSGDIGNVNVQFTVPENNTANDRNVQVNFNSKEGGIIKPFYIIQKSILSNEGFYIYDKNGGFWTIDNWNQDNTNAIGVALISSKHPDGGFVVSKKNSPENMWWAQSDSNIEGILRTEERDIAITDFKGKNNTDLALDKYGEKAESFYYCYYNGFPYPMRGYLGSAGEWYLLWQLNYSTGGFNKCINKIGGQQIEVRCYTSTDIDGIRAWAVDFWGGLITSEYKTDYDTYVRPFKTLF